MAICIYLRQEGGDLLPLEVPASGTVADVRRTVAAQQDWPVTAVQLEYQGQGLTEDGAFLADLGIGPETVVNLAADPEFSPSDTFQGSREGFAFRLGKLGLGYYKDRIGRAIKTGLQCHENEFIEAMQQDMENTAAVGAQ
eukprot:TRINITY_DN24708_c0_g1_i1.p1 TRINITY_DN24708_c0_g1~~TRINITY_DN24708_c0_g1_i1.p1  ORF type:complete len:140 (+),score=42.28 TRINITY_DN24708_c0_g1_i1:71-490(+)